TRPQGTNAGATQTNDSALAKSLMDLQRREDEAEARRDAVGLDRLLADDFFTVNFNGNVETKSDYIKRIAASDNRPDATSDYSDVTVRAYGDTAVINYRVEFKNPTGPYRYRISVVWVKQQDSWRTVTFAPT